MLPATLVAGLSMLSLLGFLVFKAHGCWLYVNGLGRAAFLSLVLGLWAFGFMVLRLPGRLAMIVGTWMVLATLPHVDSAPIAAAAAGSVALMREINTQLASAYPSQDGRGFPESMPPLSPDLSEHERRIERFYRFDYTPVWRTADGPIADYLLRAAPIRPDCVCMSFVTSSDGHFHVTTEHRVAALSDPLIGE